MFFLPEKTLLTDVHVSIDILDESSSLQKSFIKAKGDLFIENPNLDDTKFFSLQFHSINDFRFSYDKDFLLSPDFSKINCRFRIHRSEISYEYVIKDISKSKLIFSLTEDSLVFDINLNCPKGVEYFLIKQPLGN